MIKSDSEKNILVVTGEVSGDMHAAKVISTLQEELSDRSFWGIGGPCLSKTGMEITFSTDNMDVMGVSQVIRRLPFFKRVFNSIIELAQKRRPECAILVDYPGFNLRLARRLREMGICVIYYISPQVWAWNKGRIPKMARSLDRLITIFPFEPGLFEGTGLKVDFAGHPLVDEAKAVISQSPAQLPWAGQPRVALLPGSRKHEITRLLPAMKQAACRIEKTFPDASFIIAAPSEKMASLSNDIMTKGRLPPHQWRIVTGQTRHVLCQSKAAIIASGTATIEAALMRCPMVVTYRAGFLEYLAARALIRIKNIAMVNIIAGKEICPELVQHKATPNNMAAKTVPLLKESSARKVMLNELEKVRENLGEGNSEEKAAHIIVRELKKREISQQA